MQQVWTFVAVEATEHGRTQNICNRDRPLTTLGSCQRSLDGKRALPRQARRASDTSWEGTVLSSLPVLNDGPGHGVCVLQDGHQSLNDCCCKEPQVLRLQFDCQLTCSHHPLCQGLSRLGKTHRPPPQSMPLCWCGTAWNAVTQLSALFCAVPVQSSICLPGRAFLDTKESKSIGV